ncbi:MAG: ATP-dependent DNA helicase [Myxococcales bacterium]|nr:ATP-dependent DNA helicase [Myxococcales bacterium]
MTTSARAAVDLLRDVLPRFEPRPGQVAMAQAVATALADRRDLLVEAGTGTGKTLAYLLPILTAGKRAIIATATRHLQSQILQHDLPAALRASGLTLAGATSPGQGSVGVHAVGTGTRSIAVLKGRANYLCKHRIQMALQATAPGRPLSMALVAADAVSRSSPTGDRAEVIGVGDDHPVWPEVTSTADNCLGSDCLHFDTCFVVQARRRAQTADLVVVNHHLLLADYAVRERWDQGGLLPQVGVIVIDEAHALADVATAFFGSALSERRLLAVLRDLRPAAAALNDRSLGMTVQGRLDTVESAASALFRLVRTWPHQGPLGSEQLAEARLPGRALDQALAEAQDLLTHGGAGGEPAWQKAVESLYSLRSDLDRTLLPALDIDRPDAFARWVEHRGGGEHRGRDVAILARPVDVAPILQRTLLAESAVRIFTSATLTSSGRFDHVRDRLGLPADTDSVVVSGAFDYAHQALLYVPDAMPEPFAPGRDAAVADHVEQLATAAGGATFALFSSHRAMRDAYERLLPRLSMTCLAQGTEGKEQLLDRFVHEQPAVLLATMGFWQGVDLPPDALRVVIIDKIPFPPPDDPLFAARGAQLERQGGNAFTDQSLPMATIALRQGFGRLVRSRRHWGVVAVLDPRLRTKRYGPGLLASLPPATQARTFAEVRNFLIERMS